MEWDSGAVEGRYGKRPSYGDVADELRRRIRSGELRPGQRMPTQARLADEFGVDRGAVRQALRTLQSEQLLTNLSKGSPAKVAQEIPAGPQGLPQPTVALLGQRISAAFEAPRVEIDALCRTSVSLTLVVNKALVEIHAGRIRPAVIAVRVLVPARDTGLAFPAPVDGRVDGGADGGVDDRADVRLRRRWLIQRDAQCQVLRHNLLSLRGTHNVEVAVSFRELPFTPPVKLYLLNGNEALFAYYTVTRGEETVGDETVEAYGSAGTQSVLFPFEEGGGVRDTAFVEQSRLWFDALWGTISTELALPD